VRYTRRDGQVVRGDRRKAPVAVSASEVPTHLLTFSSNSLQPEVSSVSSHSRWKYYIVPAPPWTSQVTSNSQGWLLAVKEIRKVKEMSGSSEFHSREPFPSGIIRSLACFMTRSTMPYSICWAVSSVSPASLRQLYRLHSGA
jgi:hypothetical protein